MPTARLLISYDGSRFAGWSAQPGQRTVQAEVDGAIERIVGERIADGQLDSVVPHGSGHLLSAEHQALRHMLDPELAAALLTLSEDMRETVYYVAVLGMKCGEEAELMGVPAGTLLSRMHRIRTNLRRSLGMDARDPDRGHAAYTRFPH